MVEKKWVHVVPQLCHNLTKEQPSPHILKNIYTPYTSSPSLSSSSVCFPFNFPHCNFQILSLVYACNSTSRVETGDPIAFIFIKISFIFACLPAISDLKKKKKNCVGRACSCVQAARYCPRRVQHGYSYHVATPMLSCSKDSDLSKKKVIPKTVFEFLLKCWR